MSQNLAAQPAQNIAPVARKALHFNAFVMNTTSHIHHGQWRWPDAG